MSNQWKITRLRFLLSTPLSYGATESGCDFDSELPRYIRITDIRADGRLDPENAVSLPHDIAEPYLLNNWDILLARSGATVGKAFLFRANGGEACFAGYLIRARCDQRRILPEYLSYFFQSGSYWRFIKKSALQATIQNVSAELYKEVPVTHPTIKTQKIIIHYLDEQITKIDRLMDLRRRQIALLKEQRAALIQQAVTRGLNPNVPMKDSGLPWLGEIPAHWEVMPLKRELMFVTSGSRGWAEHYSDSGKLFLRISNLTRDSIDLDLSDVQLVDVPSGTEGERTHVQKGDLLISITADLGSIAIVPDNIEEAYVSQHVALARPTNKRSFSRWLGYFLISRVGKKQLEMAGLGGTKIQLTLDDVKSLLVFIPPLNEQIETLSFIEDQQAKFNVLQIAYSRQITLLAEYRAALIHECVTGRRPVPDHFDPEGCIIRSTSP